MSDSHIETVRSFLIVLYDRDLKTRATVTLPIAVAAPFANRIFKEAMPEAIDCVREPWYLLTPHCSHEGELARALRPEGSTSLYSTRYDPEQEPPPRLRLHPQAHIKYFTIQLLEFQRRIYQGNYRVDDIFLAGAEFLARRLIEQGKLGPADTVFYAVETSAKKVNVMSPDLLPSNIYEVEGVFKLPLLSDDRKRTVFHKLPAAPLPVRALVSYGDTVTYGPDGPADGAIMLSTNVYDALHRDLELSNSVEDGGYLLGVPYRQSDDGVSEDERGFRWLLEITEVVQAEAVWGKTGSLLFTGETWSRITRRRDRDFPDKKIVAWFHTHLFEATSDFGLSGMDQDLHRRFLTKPWQVAILVNIHKSTRTVRCFQRGTEGDLVECAFRVFDPSGANGT